MSDRERPRARLLSTGELARELGVSRSAVLKWATKEPTPLIRTRVVTPGGHRKFDLDEVLEDLRAARESGRDPDAE